MKSDLPPELDYIKPWLAQLPDDEIDEDPDIELLERLLIERIESLSPVAAQQRLDNDRVSLRNWLDKSESTLVANWPLVFLCDFLDDRTLLKYLLDGGRRSLVVPHTVHADVPPEFCAAHQNGMITIDHGSAHTSIVPVDETSFEIMVRQLDAGPMPPDTVCSVESVAFGPVSGRKRRLTSRTPIPTKKVDFVLRLPTGFATITTDADGVDFDESIIESFLDSLRVRTTN